MSAQLEIRAVNEVLVVQFVDTHLRDSELVDAIAQELYGLVDQQGHHKLILDFSNVAALTSLVMGLLLKLDRKLLAVKGRLVLCGLQPDLVKLFEIAHLHKVLQFAPDEPAALARLGVKASE